MYTCQRGPRSLPDAAAGNLDDPFSYRRYLYDNGNRNSFSDPSGNAPNASNGYCCLNNGNVDDNNLIGSIIGAIIGLFSGLFGGGHHSAPQPPPQVEPDDPEAYAQTTRAAKFANPLGAIIFAIPNLLVPELGGIDSVSAGLGGEVQAAAGLETSGETTTLFKTKTAM